MECTPCGSFQAKARNAVRVQHKFPESVVAGGICKNGGQQPMFAFLNMQAAGIVRITNEWHLHKTVAFISLGFFDFIWHGLKHVDLIIC